MKKIILFVFAVLLTALGVFLYFQFKDIHSNEEEVFVKQVEKIKKQKEFGIIDTDSLFVETYRIHWNENINKILKKHKVPYDLIDEMNKSLKKVFDVRKLRAGNAYYIYRSLSSERVEYLVYEHSKTEFVIFEVNKAKVLFFEKPTLIKKKVAEGTIRSSLWNTMLDQGVNPELAIALSEIYAWTIDFFDVKEGDYFKVVYEEEMIDDTLSTGIGKIHCALFNHRGNNYFAFLYRQDSIESFWDEKGNSLQKAFLKAPLRFSRISSKFTGRRLHPILKIYRPHSGVDYSAPTGTPVYSIGDGIVTRKGYERAAGNYVYIKHNSVYTSQYNHFSKFAKGLRIGQKIRQGQLIGYVGATGYATGPHLDFRIYKNGKAVDPLKVKAPPVKPIKKENHEAFMQQKERYLEELIEIRLENKSVPSSIFFH